MDTSTHTGTSVVRELAEFIQRWKKVLDQENAAAQVSRAEIGSERSRHALLSDHTAVFDQRQGRIRRVRKIWQVAVALRRDGCRADNQRTVSHHPLRQRSQRR